MKEQTTNSLRNEEPGSEDNVVAIRGVTRRFGQKAALDNVELFVPSGSVMGLVGENGAGKTTLIKHILGLLKPDNGTVRVFGKNQVADPVGVLGNIGYLSEEDILPGWMRVHELQRYARAFYSTWDQDYAERLRQEFDLDQKAQLKNLSKGQRARAGLMVALAYRPDLLVLDEPSSGLDPIVRRDILGAIIRTIADEGRSVLFSSHLLGEVERVADRVAMIQRGKILFCDTMETIKETHFRVTLRFTEQREVAPVLDGAFSWEGKGREWTAYCSGTWASIEAQAAVMGASIVEQHLPSLDEIFVARSGARAGAALED